MKPLPAQKATGTKIAGEVIPSLPTVLPPPAGPYSQANRRSSSCPVQRAYPWLLSVSTTVAAVFCLMYINKPVIVPASNADTDAVPLAEKPALSMARSGPADSASLMPNGERLPGEGASSTAHRKLPAPPSTSNFEETNLRIQHVLTAEAPDGLQARIDLDVPVLYQSRGLRWTPAEVADARALMLRLMDYQEKSLQLRAEGVELLDSWNHLIGQSIPAPALRADSPSLPANQDDSADSPRPAGLITTESIQIQPAGK